MAALGQFLMEHFPVQTHLVVDFANNGCIYYNCYAFPMQRMLVLWHDCGLLYIKTCPDGNHYGRHLGASIFLFPHLKQNHFLIQSITPESPLA